MKRFFSVFLVLVILVFSIALPVSADDYTYTPKRLLGVPTQSFITNDDGVSYQSVYAIGDNGYGMLPSAWPVGEFEMQFTFQIDSIVGAQDYVVFDMAFDRDVYGYSPTFVTYDLYVSGKGTIAERSFASSQINDHFSYKGFALYDGTLCITISFTYADAPISEEEYYFSDITYYAGSKDNAPIYNAVDDTWTDDFESVNSDLQSQNEDNISVADDVFTDVPSTFDTFVGSLTFIKAVFVKIFDKLPWVHDLLGISLVCGLFAFLFNIGGSIFSFVRNKNSSKGGKNK